MKNNIGPAHFIEVWGYRRVQWLQEKEGDREVDIIKIHHWLLFICAHLEELYYGCSRPVTAHCIKTKKTIIVINKHVVSLGVSIYAVCVYPYYTYNRHDDKVIYASLWFEHHPFVLFN